MNNEVYKEVYGHILNDAQRIRKEIMSEWGDILMFGGTMPQDVVDELSIAARITGLAFDALSNHDVPFEQVKNKPDLFRLTVREESYVCHKTAIPSMSGFLDVVNVPGVPTPSAEEQIPVKEKVNEEASKFDNEEETKVEKTMPSKKKDEEALDIKENEEDFPNIPDDVEEPTESAKPWDEVLDSETEEEKEEDLSYEAEDEEEIPEDNENAEEESESLTEEESVDKEASVDDEDKEDDVDDSDFEEVEKLPKRKAEVIGESVDVSSISKNDLFIEESRKHVDDFIYEMYQVNLTHSGYSGGGKSEEFEIMIAPLKIQKFACPSVPIIVSVYHKGKIITKSSYDQSEDGKNLVMLDVNEFYLLFRGSFDANGDFRGFVTTTGISANQGDILNVVSKTSYGDCSSRTVHNGHIKIRSMIDDEPGTIEAFPFGEPDDNEFIVMTKNDEFVDYLYISDAVKGLKKAIIFQDGVKKQVLCSWEDDYMNLKLEEV